MVNVKENIDAAPVFVEGELITPHRQRKPRRRDEYSGVHELVVGLKSSA